MKKEKIIKWFIYFAGIVCLYAFVAIRYLPFFNAVVVEKMKPGYWDLTKYGENYYFSYVRHFRENGIPPAKEKFEFKAKNSSLNDADLIVFGDSYFDISRHKQFPERLCDTFHVKTYFHYGDYPLTIFDENNYRSSEPKVLLYERVERYIPVVFEHENNSDYIPDTRSDFKKKLSGIKDDIFYDKTEKLLDALVKKSYLSTAIYSEIATIKFDLFKYISPLTPVYCLNKDKPWLFFYDQTNKEKTSFYYHHSPEEINNICNNMADLSEKLKEKYNIRLIYLPLPAQYTICHEVVNNDVYNNFLPELYEGLDKKGVEYINVFEDFKKAGKDIFYGTDGHWNEKGIQIGLKKTLEYFRNDSTLHNYF